MKTRAAIAFEAMKPLEIIDLDLGGPKMDEVLVEIIATGICHTDAYTLNEFDSEGIFPSVLGHECAGILRHFFCDVTSGVPKIVEWDMNGKIEIDPMITHVLKCEEINTGFDLMNAGKSTRPVVVF